MDGTPMTTSTRKGWQSHGSHAHVQTAMLVIAVVDLNRIREERKKDQWEDMPPQDQADSVLSTILKTFRSVILKRTPFLREKTDNHKEWVTGCCNCSQACRFFSPSS